MVALYGDSASAALDLAQEMRESRACVGDTNHRGTPRPRLSGR